MISTNDVKPGMALHLPDGLFHVIDHQHVKPGKGKAFVRLKLKGVRSGAVLDRTFRANENVTRAVINRADYQYLYRSDVGYVCMDLETFEQLPISVDVVGEAARFLVEGMTVQLSLYEGDPIGLDLAPSVELEVTYAEPAVKGNRVSGATKPVSFATGLTIQAPLFIEKGDMVKVDTRTGTYITRLS